MNEKPFDADLVRDLMKQRGVTQTGMAKIAGLPSQSAFSNILKGKRRVTAEEAAAIYTFLGIKPEPTFRVAISGDRYWYNKCGALEGGCRVAYRSYAVSDINSE